MVLGQQEKLHIVMCCINRKIPFRLCRANYTPPLGEPTTTITEEIIDEEIERASAAARSEESFPPSFPPPGPRAPQNPRVVDNAP
eukprot:11227417-Karenia_brevis.AAC.1